MRKSFPGNRNGNWRSIEYCYMIFAALNAKEHVPDTKQIVRNRLHCNFRNFLLPFVLYMICCRTIFPDLFTAEIWPKHNSKYEVLPTLEQVLVSYIVGSRRYWAPDDWTNVDENHFKHSKAVDSPMRKYSSIESEKHTDEIMRIEAVKFCNSDRPNRPVQSLWWVKY